MVLVPVLLFLFFQRFEFMWKKRFAAPLCYCSPSQGTPQASLRALKTASSSGHSPPLAKQRMFSSPDSPNYYASQNLNADTLYTGNDFRQHKPTTQADERRTGKKQRWRKLKNRGGLLEAGDSDGNEVRGNLDEENEYRLTASTDDNWRIRGRPTWDKPSGYSESISLKDAPNSRHSSRPHSPLHPSIRQLPARLSHLPPPSPSPEYISTASSPSASLTENAPRKLLILDLNGTLLVRVSSRGAIYSRPYMPSFRAYLFADQTRAWLDTMVWSSAQPHNVDRMVARVFFSELHPPPQLTKEDGRDGERWKGKLQAVWARDTLGLSTADYCELSKLFLTRSIYTYLQLPMLPLNLCISVIIHDSY